MTSPSPTRDELLATVASILEAGAAAGDIRRDTNAEDVTAALLGIFGVAGRPEQRVQAARLLDLLMDGLQPRPGSAA